MAPETPSTTTSISKVELPPWVDAASQENYAFAKDVSNKPYVAYGGDTVADQSSYTTQALDLMKNNVGVANNDYNMASQALQGVLGTPAQQVQAGNVGGMDLSQYLNPFISNVENRALDTMERSRLMGENANNASAQAANAFGGSRHGIVQGVANADTARMAGDMSSKLRREGYDAATGLATGDLNRQLQAAMANQAAGIDMVKAQTGAANAAGAVGNARQSSALADVSGMLNAGQVAQGQQQRELDDQYKRWAEEQGYDAERLNLRLASLGMSPYGRTETTTKTGESGGGPDWATAALGGLSIAKGLFALPMFSEDKAKTDIEYVGPSPFKGIPSKAYRYKTDPKTYPKVVGIMASDVEKAQPKAVRKVGKNRIIDVRKLVAA